MLPLASVQLCGVIPDQVAACWTMVLTLPQSMYEPASWQTSSLKLPTVMLPFSASPVRNLRAAASTPYSSDVLARK